MKAAWNIDLELDAASLVPLYVQLSRGIADAIVHGRLRAGDVLPGARVLASMLEVNRNTVAAAYAELIAQGLAETEQARGTFVSRLLPERSVAVEQDRLAASPRFALDALAATPMQPVPKGALQFTDGTADSRLFPVAEVSRAYRRALSKQSKGARQYGSPQGEERLRLAVARLLRDKRAMVVTGDEVLLTRGSQMGLYLAAQTLVTPGQVVAVEQLGYRYAWEAFRLAGARLIAIPVDEGGMRVDLLEELCSRESVRAVLLTPHHQYPTAVTLQTCRRLQLLQLAARERMAVIEDDYDHEFQYDAKPVLPLASADRDGVVVYIATFTKLLGPGFRLGYVAAPKPVIERMSALRAFIDRQGDAPLELAVAEMLEEGELPRFVRKARLEYASRRDVFAGLLEQHCRGALEFDLPAGGLALWVKAGEGVRFAEVRERALQLGLYFDDPRSYAFEAPIPNAVRLGFASMNHDELAAATRLLARSLRS